MIAVVGLVLGALIGILLEPTVPLVLQPYLPIAVVAALDAVFGGIRARFDGIFDAKVFVVSFVSNVVVAALIVFLGDQLGVGAQLSTAVVVVLGIRIFGNAAAVVDWLPSRHEKRTGVALDTMTLRGLLAVARTIPSSRPPPERRAF